MTKPGRSKHLRFLLTTLLVAVAALAGLGVILNLRSSSPSIPTARVQRGDVALEIHTDGELRTLKSVRLMAPSSSGALKIVFIAKTGTFVHAGDVVVEFDPADQEYDLEQNRSKFLQAEQDIIKNKADAAVQMAQDKVELLKDRFAVRRAEIEVSRNELVSGIDARKNVLALEEARRRLAQLQKDIESRGSSNQAGLAVLEQNRNQARVAMQQVQTQLDNMKIKAPIDGFVSIQANEGDYFRGRTGMLLPEFREGDAIMPGYPVALVLDPSDIEAVAWVSDNDRANVNPGQPVEIHLDAYPNAVYPARVKTISGASSEHRLLDIFVPRFEVHCELIRTDERLRPGFSTQTIIRNKVLTGQLSLPRQALFEKSGLPVVYVKTDGRFESRPVKVAYRTETRIVVEDLLEGTEVALVNPEDSAERRKKAPEKTAPSVKGEPR